MNPKKSGTIFIVLIIAFVAFGFGSIADALNLDGDAIVNLIPANFSSVNQQVTQIGDPSFEPVNLVTHVVITENTTTNNNSTNNTNNTSR